jgi:3-oxoacyl-[acyl-carrier-protein] synthase-3
VSGQISSTSPHGAETAARIRAVATHLPAAVLGNHELADLFPGWSEGKILEKTGIEARRVAGPDETAADLAFEAAERLFAAGACERDEIDFLIFCSQAPDYILPTTACVLQDRLGLRRDIGAMDFNLGCSGFVYGLSIAAGLIAAGAARTILLLTADTYSKYINPLDKSVRTLFGDGAAATLVEASTNGGSVGPFVFGTDGRGAKDLIVEAGGFRTPRCAETGVEAEDGMGNIRSRDNLYMNGANVMNFTLREVPRTYRRLLDLAGLNPSDVDHVVLHQANKFMLDALQKKLGVPDGKLPRFYETVGNTVSSTIPFVLEDLLASGRLERGMKVMLIGFGVGLSWAGALATW